MRLKAAFDYCVFSRACTRKKVYINSVKFSLWNGIERQHTNVCMIKCVFVKLFRTYQ